MIASDNRAEYVFLRLCLSTEEDQIEDDHVERVNAGTELVYHHRQEGISSPKVGEDPADSLFLIATGRHLGDVADERRHLGR